MKIPARLLLASAAFVVTALSSHCLAATQVTLDLTGQVIQSGKSILLSSTTPIDHSEIYYYSVTGTCHGTGAFANAIPTGTDLDTALALVSSDVPLVPYLQGTVLDLSDKFPFTCVNKVGKGSFNIQGVGTAVGTARVKAGITKTGICYGDFTNIAFGLKTRFGTIPDKSDTIVFESGQVLVQTSPITSGTQPDLSFAGLNGLVGVGVTGTDGSGETFQPVLPLKKGHSITLPVILQNAGIVADTYKLTATPPGAGFTQEFIYKGKNITAIVTGSTGFTVPPDKGMTTETLTSGGVLPLTWTVKNASALSGSSSSVLTATSDASGAQDAIRFSVSAP